MVTRVSESLPKPEGVVDLSPSSSIPSVLCQYQPFCFEHRCKRTWSWSCIGTRWSSNCIFQPHTHQGRKGLQRHSEGVPSGGVCYQTVSSLPPWSSIQAYTDRAPLQWLSSQKWKGCLHVGLWLCRNLISKSNISQSHRMVMRMPCHDVIPLTLSLLHALPPSFGQT